MPRNKYPEETVQIILDAALKVFLEKGFERATVLDIVDGMGGLTRGAFYHHFKSKEEVLDALGTRLFYENNPFDKVKHRTDLNGLDKIKYLLTFSLEDSDHHKISTEGMQVLESPTFLKKHIEENRDLLPPFYQDLIEEGVKDGSIHTDHPKLLAELFTILTNFWIIPIIYPSSSQETKERLFFIKEITDNLGLPVLDNETITLALKQLTDLK